MLLNILQCTGQPHNKESSGPKRQRAKVEKHWVTGRVRVGMGSQEEEAI